MVMFLLSFVKGSKSAEGGSNPLADIDPGGPILGGSKSARTPAFCQQLKCACLRMTSMFIKFI